MSKSSGLAMSSHEKIRPTSTRVSGLLRPGSSAATPNVPAKTTSVAAGLPSTASVKLLASKSASSCGRSLPGASPVSASTRGSCRSRPSRTAGSIVTVAFVSWSSMNPKAPAPLSAPMVMWVTSISGPTKASVSTKNPPSSTPTSMWTTMSRLSSIEPRMDTRPPSSERSRPGRPLNDVTTVMSNRVPAASSMSVTLPGTASRSSSAWRRAAGLSMLTPIWSRTPASNRPMSVSGFVTGVSAAARPPRFATSGRPRRSRSAAAAARSASCATRSPKVAPAWPGGSGTGRTGGWLPLTACPSAGTIAMFWEPSASPSWFTSASEFRPERNAPSTPPGTSSWRSLGSTFSYRTVSTMPNSPPIRMTPAAPAPPVRTASPSWPTIRRPSVPVPPS